MTELCSICHNNIEKNKNIVITECSHTFHFSCLLKNIKQNISTGNQCPLCRFNFIKLIKPPGNFTTTGNLNSYTFINRRVMRPVLTPAVRPGFLLDRPAVRPVIRPAVRPVIRPAVRQVISPAAVNLIIPRRQIRRVRDKHASKRKRIKKRIEKLTYKQLKKKLKDLNLSTRGYMRTSFEKRLINHLLVVE